MEKDKKPTAQSTEKAPKQPEKIHLFDDDDDDFFVGTTKKTPGPGTSLSVQWRVKRKRSLKFKL